LLKVKFDSSFIKGESSLDIKDLIQKLNNENMYLSSYGYETIEQIFNIIPHEYLKFMEEDLKKTDKRSIINALANGKRAMNC